MVPWGTGNPISSGYLDTLVFLTEKPPPLSFSAGGGSMSRKEFFMIGKTDEEISLVCRSEDTPDITSERDDGWRGFRIQGILDFSLIGILSKLSGILAEHQIGIFAVSIYNTDYILVKEENFEKALAVLATEGYQIM